MAREHLARQLAVALRAALKRGPPDDRAFISRWLAEADDPAFERLGTDIIARGKIGENPHLIYRTVISLTLSSWHTATDLKHGVDALSWRTQREIAELLALAHKADDLANFFRGSAKRNLLSLISPQVRLGPLIERRGLTSIQHLAALHSREARVFRRFAAKEAEKDRARTSLYRVSRIKRARERIAFMRLMVADLCGLCGKPHYDAVAAITNIAFPSADMTSENVRAARRPTTRQGRRRKTGALGREKRT
jgi:hypothetical protein